MTPEKVTIYRHHIPHQVEIDRVLTELCTKVIRQLVINFEMADLISEYDRSARFKDVYSYIVRDKLPDNQQVQRRVLGESANYIVVNANLHNGGRMNDHTKLSSENED